jgi:hypothetical protein
MSEMALSQCSEEFYTLCYVRAFYIIDLTINVQVLSEKFLKTITRTEMVQYTTL